MPHLIPEHQIQHELDTYQHERTLMKKRLYEETPFCGRFTRSPCICCGVCLFCLAISIAIIFVGVFVGKPGSLSADPIYNMVYVGVVLLGVSLGVLIIAAVWISRLRRRHVQHELERYYPRMPLRGSTVIIVPQSPDPSEKYTPSVRDEEEGERRYANFSQPKAKKQRPPPAGAAHRSPSKVSDDVVVYAEPDVILASNGSGRNPRRPNPAEVHYAQPMPIHSTKVTFKEYEDDQGYLLPATTNSKKGHWRPNESALI